MKKLSLTQLRKSFLRRIPYSAENGYYYINKGQGRMWHERCEKFTTTLDWLCPVALTIATLFCLSSLIFHSSILFVIGGTLLAASLFSMAFLLWIDKQVEILTNFINF